MLDSLVPARMAALRGDVLRLLRRPAEDLTKFAAGVYKICPAVYVSAQRALEPQHLWGSTALNEQGLVYLDAVADDVDKPDWMFNFADAPL